MGKSTISMAIFNSFLLVYQRVGEKKRIKFQVELLASSFGRCMAESSSARQEDRV
jgi:hypothetical protein